MGSFELALLNWWRAAALAVLIAVANAAMSLLLGLIPTVESQVVAMVVVGVPATVATSTIAQAAWLCLIASGARGESLTIRAVLGRGLSRAWPLFLCNLVAGVCIAVGLMACIVPGVFFALMWCLAAPAVVLGGAGPMVALADSSRLGRGHRVSLLGALVVAFLIATVLGLVLAVGRSAALLALRVSFHQAVFEKVDAFSSHSFSVLAMLAWVPMVTVTVLAYLRLSRREQLANLGNG